MTIYYKSIPPQGFYVYAYLREDGTPYYIGKGKAFRAWNKNKKEIGKPTANRIIILEQNLSELGALAIERRMIRWYGRLDNNTGSLRNKTDGGDGICGWKHSLETIEKVRSGNLGKKCSEETKIKMRLAKLGKPKSLEHKANMSKAQKLAGNRPPPWSPDRKRKKGKLIVEN